MFLGKRPGALEDCVGKLRLSDDDVIALQAQLRAVRASRRKLRRREYTVDFGNRSSADQRQRAVETRGEIDEQVDERGLRPHVARMALDVDERAVDVQEHRRYVATEIVRWLGHVRRVT